MVWNVSKEELNRRLDRNQFNLVRIGFEDDFLEFDDIIAAERIEGTKGGGFKREDMYQYRLVRTGAQSEFDNANMKTPAWTDSLEFEAGESLSLTTEPILLCGKSHKFQLFVRERHVEPEFRERDGMFICPKDDAVILLSAKARFGLAERNELIRDITCGKRAAAAGEEEDGGEGFIIHDWLFQTSSQCQGKTLHEIPGFEKYHGKRSFKYFVGVAASPLISERVLNCDSGSSRGHAPPIAFMSRHISQEYSYAAALAVPFLFARSLANKMFMRCNR